MLALKQVKGHHNSW